MRLFKGAKGSFHNARVCPHRQSLLGQHMELSYFNFKHGYLEAVVRGYRSAFLKPNDYRRMKAAETLEDMFCIT